MSNLSDTLNELVEKNALKKGKLAKKTGVPKKRLVRILSGKQRFIGNSEFKAIAKAVSPDEMDQAHLVAARMMDVRIGPAADLVSIQIKGHTLNPKSGKTLPASQ